MTIYIYIYIYEGHTISFQTFFVWTFKAVVDSWRFSMLLLYYYKMADQFFMISGSNEQLQQELEYILIKPDCPSWWISKMQSDTLEERYAIKFCFKLGKNATETYGMLQTAFRPSCMNQASVLSSIRDSKKAGSLWGRMRAVGGVRKSIDQSWLAKGLGLGLLCWGFKGVQEEIPREEASTLEIGSVAFPPGQCFCLQLHPCHRLFAQDGHQDSSSPSLLSRPCSLWLLVIPWGQRLSLWDNWGDERGCDEGHWYAHIRGLPWGVPEVVGTVQQVHCSRRRLLRRGVEFHVCTINKSAHTKKVWKLIVCNSYICIWMCADKWLMLNCYCYIATLETIKTFANKMRTSSFYDFIRMC